jgi:hypothetical protein
MIIIDNYRLLIRRTVSSASKPLTAKHHIEKRVEKG